MPSKTYAIGHQFLTVGIAKHYALNARGKVVEIPRGHDAPRGSSPLMILGLVEPALRRCQRMLIDAQHPIAMSAFLSRCWHKDGRFNVPDILTMKRDLHTCDRGFLKWAQAYGVKTVAAKETGDIRSVTAFTNASINVSFYLDEDPCEIGKANDELYQTSMIRMALGPLPPEQRAANDLERKKRENACRKPVKSSIAPILEMDWEPKKMRLIAPTQKPEMQIDPGLRLKRTDSSPPVWIKGLKEVIAMWPGGTRYLFEGFAGTRREITLWLSGRCHIDSSDLSLLRTRVGIDRRFEYEYWQDFRLETGQLLVATRGVKPSIVCRAYSALVGLWPWLAFEIVSPQGQRDTWRVLYFAKGQCEGNIVLFHPQSPATALLDGPVRQSSRAVDKLEDLSPDPIRATPDVWDDVQMIIDNHSNFVTPQLIAGEFSMRHDEWLVQVKESMS